MLTSTIYLNKNNPFLYIYIGICVNEGIQVGMYACIYIYVQIYIYVYTNKELVYKIYGAYFCNNIIF